MKKPLVLLALAAMALLVVAPAALAQGLPVKGGATKLKVDSGTARALSGAGVSVNPVGKARGAAPRFAFPISGGRVTTGPLHGEIRHAGGLRFAGGGNSLVVEKFVIDLDKGILTARVPAADARVPLLKLSGGKKELDGRVVSLRDVTAKLTPQAAAALNDTFNTNLFKGGLLIGKTDTNAKIK